MLGSTACAASSMTTTSNCDVIRANMPLPLNDNVEHTTAASSRIASFTLSFSSARSNFFSEDAAAPAAKSPTSPTRSLTSASMETLSTLWCTFTPTRTSVGEYDVPFGPSNPECIMRRTISSSAELLGAHTKTFVRLFSRSPTISAFSGGGVGI